MTVRRTIRRYIANDLLESDSFSGDPLADGRLDSLAIEQLVVFLEEAYGFTVTDEELGATNMGSIDALVAYVKRKRKEAAR